MSPSVRERFAQKRRRLESGSPSEVAKSVPDPRVGSSDVSAAPVRSPTKTVPPTTLKRNFSTWSAPNYILSMKAEERQRILHDNEIVVEGQDVSNPVSLVKDLKLPGCLAALLENEFRFRTLKPVQMQGLPIMYDAALQCSVLREQLFK